MRITGLFKTHYQLDTKSLNSGGEGDIYRILNGTEKKLAKIYHPDAISPELEEKLKYMVSNPPGSKVLSQVAWPLDIAYDAAGSFCGFIMSELNINAELTEIYKYPSIMNISSQQKIIIAENICIVIAAVHKAGYIFGDFNPRNIGVDLNTGKVAFLDTDTYHVTDNSSNKTYRCNVCASGYAAPELLEKCSDYASSHPNDSKQIYAKTPLPTFTKETDYFALSIHIFKLLNNGYTPFGGINEHETASQASPGVGDAAVRRNNYCFKPGNKPQSAAVPPLEVFPQEIADMFTNAFIIGKKVPEQRPSSLDWHTALEKYEASLVACSKNKLHQYDKKNGYCPFCEADQLYKISLGQKTYSKPAEPSPVLPKQTVNPSFVANNPHTTSSSINERHIFTTVWLILGILFCLVTGYPFIISLFSFGSITIGLALFGFSFIFEALCLFLILRWNKIGVYFLFMLFFFFAISIFLVPGDAFNRVFFIFGLIRLLTYWGALQIPKNGRTTWEQLYSNTKPINTYHEKLIKIFFILIIAFSILRILYFPIKNFIDERSDNEQTKTSWLDTELSPLPAGPLDSSRQDETRLTFPDE